MKQHIVISAVGGDRVGMVHELSKAIADSGGSISESRMTALGSDFAMLMLVAGNWHSIARIETDLGKLAEASGVTIQVRRTTERAVREVPVLRMLNEPAETVRARAERLAAAGSLMGIEVLDHLVLGAGRYVSLKERGAL